MYFYIYISIFEIVKCQKLTLYTIYLFLWYSYINITTKVFTGRPQPWNIKSLCLISKDVVASFPCFLICNVGWKVLGLFNNLNFYPILVFSEPLKIILKCKSNFYFYFCILIVSECIQPIDVKYIFNNNLVIFFNCFQI